MPLCAWCLCVWCPASLSGVLVADWLVPSVTLQELANRMAATYGRVDFLYMNAGAAGAVCSAGAVLSVCVQLPSFWLLTQAPARHSARACVLPGCAPCMPERAGVL